MIYDGHAYCFLTQEIASEGFADPAEYWRWLQLFMTFARQQPSWRCQDRHAAGMADSNSHAPFNIPVVLAGGGAGTIKGGRHLAFKGERLANLHLTLMDHMGVHVDQIGDSTERVDPRLLTLA